MDKLIIDSGGTKSDLVRLKEGKISYMECAGLHPAYSDETKITDELDKTVNFTPDAIYFYGAGCHGEGPKNKITRSLRQLYSSAAIEVNDDLTGAARAHLKQKEGLVVSLGTGSISGRYLKGEIIQKSASLGYAIGDEGSAVDLGRLALKAYFRRELDKDTAEVVGERIKENDYSRWMQQIYESDKPNRQLASVAGMVFREPLTGQLRELAENAFLDFINSQFTTLSPSADEQVVCTGTVACSHEKLLVSVMNKKGFTRVSVEKSIIRGLADYHKA